jgi:hypothetical protein
MAAGKNSKWVVALVTLFVPVVANAAPTIINGRADVPARRVSQAADARVFFLPEANRTAEYCDSQLAAIGAELLKPPPGFVPSPPVQAKALPAVPGAIMMALVGFFCVSLVRDRRVWLTALATLLWAGEYGIQVLPHLAVRLSHARGHPHKAALEFNCPHRLETSRRLRSDIEGTQYIGLLRHLAGIPQIKRLAQSHCQGKRPRTLAQTEERLKEYRLAVAAALFNSALPGSCSALAAEQFISFSPAFIFDSLARGPPLLS